MTFDGTSGLFSGTPSPFSGGVYNITLVASNDNSMSAPQAFTLTVNEAPHFGSLNNATFAVNLPGSFTVSALGYPAPTLNINGQLPRGLNLNPHTGVLSGTPTTAGVYTFSLTLFNGIGPVVIQNFTLTVTSGVVITSPNAATFTIGVPGSFTITATGVPAPTFQIQGCCLPNGVSLNSETGVISGTPFSNSQTGVSNVVVIARNMNSTAQQNFTLTLDGPPRIISPNAAKFTVGAAGSFTVQVDPHAGYPAPTFSETGALPAGVNLNSTNGVLSGTPAAGTGGSYPIIITAANGTLPNATQSFTLTVNESPTITSANSFSVAVGSPPSFTVTSTANPKASYLYSGGGTLPPGVFLNPNSGAFYGTPAAGSSGAYQGTATASNGVLPNATQAFTIYVDAPPTITSANMATFIAGTPSAFNVVASGYPAPTFSVTGNLPNGVTLNPNTGVIAGTPAVGTGGVYNFGITATNTYSPNATQNFTLIVDQATIISSPNATTFKVGSSGLFTVVATGYPTPAFTETGALPAGVTLTSSGVLSGTPAAGTGGFYSITICACNGIGTSGTQTFGLTVDQPLVITSATAARFAVENPGSFTIKTTGYPAPVFSEQGTLPSGVKLNATTGVISGTPAAGSAGVYKLLLTASNGLSANASQNFTLQIGDFKLTASPQSITVPVGQDAVFSLQSVPVDGLTGSVALTCSGDPPSGTCTAVPTSIPTNGTSQITVHEPIGTSPGTYTLKFIGRLGALAHQATVTLILQ